MTPFVRPKAFFLPTLRGQRFCLLHSARSKTPHGIVVYVHPFAEEMNKSRRMAALQARALAYSGYLVLQMDLLGCGDSSGDFGDALWQSWVDDVVQASHWLRQQSDTFGVEPRNAPLWLWGLRAGCLLSVEAAEQIREPCNFLFWQAPPTGKVLLQQFLRLHLATDMLTGQSKGSMDRLRQKLNEGIPVEIAGYMLSAALARGLEQAVLIPPACKEPTPRLEWFEVSPMEAPSLASVSAKTLSQWQQSGYAVSSHVTQGPAFWQTSEIEEVPELLSATTLSLQPVAT